MDMEILCLSSDCEPCFEKMEDATFIGVSRILKGKPDLVGERVDLYIRNIHTSNPEFLIRFGWGDLAQTKNDILQNAQCGITGFFLEFLNFWENEKENILSYLRHSKPTFREFVLGGKAIFTVHNDKGQHYTYKVFANKTNRKWGAQWFVYLLTGPDNNHNYSYIGTLDSITGVVRITQASKMDSDSLPIKVVNWALQKIVWPNQLHKLPKGYGIKHEGRCGRCGRTLTTPESIECGIGPECLTKMGF